jgi:hypothetical protein
MCFNYDKLKAGTKLEKMCTGVRQPMPTLYKKNYGRAMQMISQAI